MVNKVRGYDYVAGGAVELTPAEWRAKYPLATHIRVVENGETTYRQRQPRPGASWPNNRVAEAYAVIPAGSTKP